MSSASVRGHYFSLFQARQLFGPLAPYKQEALIDPRTAHRVATLRPPHPAAAGLAGCLDHTGKNVLAEELYLVDEIGQAGHLDPRPRLERERVGECHKGMV